MLSIEGENRYLLRKRTLFMDTGTGLSLKLAVSL